MIIVHGTIPIRPEAMEQALELARVMVEATIEEDGCISYDFYVGLSDPNSLMLFQEWQDMDSLSEHFRTPHMDTFLSALPDVVSGEITTRRYAVQSVDEMDANAADPEPEDPPVVH